MSRASGGCTICPRTCPTPRSPKWPSRSAARRPAAISCRRSCTGWWSFPACCAATKASRCSRWRAERGSGCHPALLRRHREVRAAARVLERRRVRPAGAQLPRADPRRQRADILGDRRREPRLPLQQLHLALPQPPPGPDGRAGDVPAAQQRAAGRGGAARRLAGQDRHRRRARSGRPTWPAASPRSATTARPTRRIPTCCSCATSCCGACSPKAAYEKEIQAAPRHTCKSLDKPHWREFLKLWNEA